MDEPTVVRPSVEDFNQADSDRLDVLALELGVAAMAPDDQAYIELHTVGGLRKYSWLELTLAHVRLMKAHRQEPSP